MWTRSELRSLQALRTPAGIQRFLDRSPYHVATTAWSPRLVLHHRTAHCLEGAIFAAAALRANGYPPLVLDLEAERDTDHVIAVFQRRGLWGAIGSSNYSTCRWREPVYRTLRELSMSYFDGYFNLAGERSLRSYSRPISLARFDRRNWMTTEEPLWFIAEHLLEVAHTRLLPRWAERGISRVDSRMKAAGLVGHRK
jgi:hypothetical protein